MRRFPRLMRAIAYTLTLTTSLAPTYSYAAQAQNNTDLDDFSQLGRGGQSFGDSLRNEALSNPANVSGGSISLPSRGDDGSLTFDPNDQFSINELYPGTSASNSDSLDYYFSDSTKPDIGDIQGAYDSNAKMGEKGDHAKGSLYDDANSGTPSISGAAYQVLVDQANASKPDFRNDPVLNLTKNTFDNIESIASEFGDCSSETIFDDITMSVHNPKYETCDRVVDKSAECSVLHDYEAAVVKHHGGPYNLSSCGEGCADLWIGKVGDNYWSGNCSIYEEYTEILLVNPDAITSAVLTNALWDDYIQVYLGPPDNETKIWQGPNNNFPPETDGKCELSTSWNEHPNVDITNLLKSYPENSVLRFKIRVSVTGSGEGYGKVRINFDPTKAIIRDNWSPDSCIESSLGVADGFAGGTLECVDDGTTEDGCAYTNGIKICEHHLKPSPIPGISNLCKEIEVKASYDYYKGQLECFEDVNGVEQCIENDGGNLDTCTKYDDNPQCGFISGTCVEGAMGDSGTCYVNEETWDCGTSVDINTVEKNTKYECSGAIRCMGDDCLDPEQSENQSGNFAKASALLNAAQFMTQDLTCTGLNEDGSATTTENVHCTAFGGEAGECKIAVGGVSDCCEKPSNIGMSEYLSMIMAVPKLDAAIGSLSDTNIIKSSYQVIRQPVMDSWSVVTDPFTSHMDNISGAVTEFFEPLTTLKDQLMDALNEKMTSVIESVFGEVAKDTAIDAGVQAGASEAASESIMANPASSMLGTLMSAYTAYVVTVAVIQMIYSCEKKEFEMNAKRATDSCTHVGSYCKSKILGLCIEKRQSYCCFNSPLSRIIQEQVRGQLGQSFGSAKHPSCEGIPLDKIADIDWDRINLDEWLAILQANGQFPEEQKISIDSLTGSGSIFDTDGTRLPADQRVTERIGGVDIDGKRNEAMNKIGVNFKGTGNR